jgi:Flp pilus assembly protein TadG
MMRGLLRSQRGTAAIEMAIGLSVFVVAIFGVLEMGRLMWAQNALNFAVQQGARCMLVGTCDTTSAPTTAANASGFGFDKSVFTATTPACGNQVAASYSYSFMTSLIVDAPITLTATACM